MTTLYCPDCKHPLHLCGAHIGTHCEGRPQDAPKPKSDLKQPRAVYVTESIKIQKKTLARLKIIREAMEQQLGRTFTLDELFELICEEFLENQSNK